MAGAENGQTGLRQRNVSGKPDLTIARVYVPTAEGRKRDEVLDKHTECAPPKCSFWLCAIADTLSPQV